MSGSQACRGSLYEPIEKEMCHLKAEKYKSFWMFTESDTISLSVCLYVFSFYSITPLCPYYVCSNPKMIIFSVDRHHLASGADPGFQKRGFKGRKGGSFA